MEILIYFIYYIFGMIVWYILTSFINGLLLRDNNNVENIYDSFFWLSNGIYLIGVGIKTIINYFSKKGN